MQKSPMPKNVWRITSFLYGLLRPLDKIKSYRAEGNIALPEWGDIPLFDYWRPKLTPYLLQEIEARGGILFNLASDEMRRLFDWKTVETQAASSRPNSKYDTTTAGKQSSSTPKWLAAHLPVTC